MELLSQLKFIHHNSQSEVKLGAMIFSSKAFVTGFESIFVVFIRLVLFATCRKYLLRSLYHDLQNLSSEADQTVSSTAGIDGEVELEILPSPSTANLRPHDSSAFAIKRTFHSTVSRTIFSLCFSECCTLFLLLMFQALDILQPLTRLLHWVISLSLLIALIVAFIPLSYSLVLSYRSAPGLQRPTPTRLFLTACPVGLFLFLLSFIPLPVGIASNGITSVVLARLTVVGTFILGTLSGFGAVENAWKYFPILSRHSSKLPTDDDVDVAEEGLRRIRNDLSERRQTVSRLEAAQPKADASWLPTVFPNFRGDNQMSSARQEIVGLEALEYQMARNVAALKQRREEDRFSNTLAGRLTNVGGCLFALYCVYRIFVAIVNIVSPARTAASEMPTTGDKPRTDFITMLLAYLVSFAPKVHLEHDEIAMMARQINLVLVGVIILSSVRRVLRGVASALRISTRKLGASLMLLMLAQLMGIYLLSTLVQLRTSFPPPLSRPDAEPHVDVVNLFSTLPEYQVFGSVFDSSFLITAAVSTIVRWFNQRINSVGILDIH